MNNVNKCHQCKNYILGTFCYTCNKDVTEMEPDDAFFDFFKEILKDKKDD